MRLLIWNIQFFTETRIHNTEVTNTAADIANEQRAIANLMYIINTVKQADPDVFVILEARSGQGNIEELANGNGPPGLLLMLSYLRALKVDWCLVPPLRVNPRDILLSATYTETVGVFWRNDRLDFTGPYVWPSARAGSGPPIPPLSGATANYPSPWDKAVPPGLRAAPRCQFTSTSGKPIILANPESAYARRPYLTTFSERAGMRRDIKLFSVHTKPDEALQALIQLTALQGADWAPGNNQVTVFAGDFNVNLRGGLGPLDESKVDYFESGSFGNITRLRAPMYQPGAALPKSVVHPVRAATPAIYLKNSLLDYGFVSYGTNATPNPQPAVRAVVVEPVAGVAPGGALPSFATDMETSLADIGNVAASSLVNIAASPGGAVRAKKTTTITTTAAHGLSPGNRFTISGVRRADFNVSSMVVTVPSATTFTFTQDKKPNAKSGGGQVNKLPRVNAFIQRWNYGHISPPGAGVSDHLPVLILI